MIKIEQDGFYLNAMGEILNIKITDNFAEDENSNLCTLDGKCYGNAPDKYDLIGYIPPELHYSILKTINGYHKNESYKSFVDKGFKRRLNE